MAARQNVAELAVRILADGVEPAAKDLRKVEDAGQRAERGLRGLANAGGLLKGALAGLGVGAAVSLALSASTDLARANAQLTGTAKLTGASLAELRRSAAETESTFKVSKDVAGGYAVELTKLATKAGEAQKAQAGITAFLEIGAAKGLDAAATLEAVRQAALGIDEGTDKLFGKNPSALYEEYAQQIGTTAGKLTDQQKAQALLDAALRDGERARGSFAEFGKTVPGQLAQLKTEVTGLTQDVAEGLTPALLGGVGGLRDLTGFVRENGPLVVGLGVAAAGAWGLARALTAVAAAQAAVTTAGGTAGALAGARALAGRGLAAAGGPVGLMVGVALGGMAYGRAKEAQQRAAENAAFEKLAAGMTGGQREAHLGGLANARASVAVALRSAETPSAVGGRVTTLSQQVDSARIRSLEAELDLLDRQIATFRRAAQENAPTATPAAGGKPAPTKPRTAAQQRAAANRDARDAAIRRGDFHHDDYSTYADPLTATGRGGFDAVDAARANDFGRFDPSASITEGLAGVERYLGERERYRGLQQGLAAGVAGALGDGLAAGIERGIATGNVGEGFRALTGALLGGLGDSVMQFGLGALKAAIVMDGLLNSFMNLLPGGAIVKAVAMIGIGAGLKAVAGRAFGGSRGGAGGVGGGYAGGYGGAFSADAGGATVIDRGVISGAFGTPTPARSADTLVAPRAPVTNNVWLVGPDDPTAQRQMFALLNNGAARGLRLQIP